MKLLFSILVFAICNDTVESYITGSSPIGGANWMKGNNAINHISTKKAPSTETTAAADVEDLFRKEYNEWATRYGKTTTDERRFEIFKRNYMMQMQHNKKTGSFRLLNEFGDMTEKEFELGEYETQKSENSPKSADNVVEVELVMDDPVPKVRMLDSETIPRVSDFEIPHNRWRHEITQQQQRQRQQAPADFEPKVNPIRYPSMEEPRRRKRRVVRLQVGPDRIL